MQKSRDIHKKNVPQAADSAENQKDQPGDKLNWAAKVERMEVHETPPGAINLNMEGRRLTGPLQGFGPLWEKVYEVRLEGVTLEPREVLRIWKENFARFQPPEIHFHAPVEGVKAGEVMPIDFMLPAIPGLPEVFPMASGVKIIYSDEQAFTVMTPEGFPISGWNTFSVEDDNGTPLVRVHSLIRTMDPVYEFGYRFMGGSEKQEGDWIRVLQNVAQHFGVDSEVTVRSTCLDPKYQWREAGNLWQNAAIRTFFYWLSAPLRRAGKKIKR